MQPILDLRRLLRGIDLELIEMSASIVGEGSFVRNWVQGANGSKREMSEGADD